MNTYRHNALRIAVTLGIGALLLTGVAMAQDAPATLPETGASLTRVNAAANATANDYITQLDELRVLGESKTVRTTAVLANPSVYEFSSDLDRLNAMSSPGTVRATANDYITTLDQLRSMSAR